MRKDERNAALVIMAWELLFTYGLARVNIPLIATSTLLLVVIFAGSYRCSKIKKRLKRYQLAADEKIRGEVNGR